MLIGLTGLYCAGKNHVAAILETQGLPVLDADALGHTVIEQQKTAICARFGENILNPDGTVNRKLLSAKVFGNDKALGELEAIVHPEVNRLTCGWIDEQNGKNCVINAALIHKSAVFSKLDCIILVSAPWFIRLLRAKKRDRLPLASLLRRFRRQKQFPSQYLAGNADIYRVENPGIGFARKHLEMRVDAILTELRLKTEP